MIVQDCFGHLPDGAAVTRYTLANKNGMQVQLMDYGATLLAVKVPDRQGKIADVLLGFDHLTPYLNNVHYLGSLVGRYANRIAGGGLSLSGRHYSLSINNHGNHLHGGVEGFHRRLWRGTTNGSGVDLMMVSADGDQGFPGNLDVTVTYTLTEENVLCLDYRATTDQTTVVNLTSHGYFNLAGSGGIENHRLQLFAERFLPVDEHGIPTGEYRSVIGTAMDFRHGAVIGDHLVMEDAQVRLAGGLDHNWVIDPIDGEKLMPVARLVEPVSGRTLEVRTTQPGVQCYTGNGLDETVIGKTGPYRRYAGLCLETQHFPDAPNQPDFLTPVLCPGEVYSQQTRYCFGVEK